MFENLIITPAATKDMLRIHIQWHWLYEENKALPSCSVFCCAIPEHRLLQEMIFRQDDIINWINAKVLDISSPQNRISNIEDFYKHSAETGMQCTLNQYTLMGDISKHVDLTFPLSDSDKIFLICVYGERSFDVKVVSIPPLESNIPFELLQHGNALAKLLGKGTLAIKFDGDSTRQRVLVTNFNGERIYSVIPPGENKYYFEKSITADDIKGVEYLSYQIGQ